MTRPLTLALLLLPLWVGAQVREDQSFTTTGPMLVGYGKTPGSSVERLAKCAPGDVTSAALAPTWSGDAARIFNTRLKQ